MTILIIGFTCPPTIHFKFILCATAYVIPKGDGLLLQSATSVITKGERYYKVRQNGRFEKKARTQQKMHGVSPTNLLEFRKRETF